MRAADVHTASELSAAVLNVVGTCRWATSSTGGSPRARRWRSRPAASCPADADAVVMVEHTSPFGGSGDGSGGGARIEVARAVAPGANVVMAGEDLTRGEHVLPAGRRLRAADLGAARHLRRRLGRGLPPAARRRAVDGERALRARRRRRARARCATPTRSRSPPRVAAAGCDVTRAGIVPDDAAALRAAVHAAARRARRRDPLGRLVDRDEGSLRRGARRSAAARRPVPRHRHPPGQADAVRARGRQAGDRHARVSHLVAGGVRRLHPPAALAPGRRDRRASPGPRAAPRASAPRIARRSGARTTCASRSTSATAACGPIRCAAARRRSPTWCAPMASSCVPADVEQLDAGAPVEVLVYL